MFDREKWAEVFQVLGKNPFRTIATAFGVVWGIMMLIIMIGSGTGLENGVKSDFNRVTNCMYIWTQTTSKAYAGLNRGRNFNFHNADLEYLKSSVPEIDIISPRNQLGGYNGANNVTHGIQTGSFSIYGDTQDYFRIDPHPLLKGRFINERDLAEGRKVCVIGQRVYTDLFEKGEEAIGSLIKINGVNFQVIGLYKSNMTGDNAEEDTQSIYIPITTFQRAFNYGDIIGWFSITSDEGVLVSEMEANILEKLKVRHKIHPEDDRAFGHYNGEEEFLEMNNLFFGIRALSWFVGILTLFAGVIGVSNIMLIIIKERTKEIGVRKALGATPSNIVSQIMLESLFLSTIAGFVGIIIGVWALEGVQLLIGDSGGVFRNPRVTFEVVFLALLVLIVCGVISGILPAFRAAKIKPVEALRAE